MYFYYLAISFLMIAFSCKDTKPVGDAPTSSPSVKTAAATVPSTNDVSSLPVASGPSTTPIEDESVAPPVYLPGKIPGGGGGHRKRDYVHFVPNSYEFWTNPVYATTHLLEGCTGDNCECEPGEPQCQALPAFANILEETSNFVWCKGGPYAVCYYSGPSDGATDLSCKLSEDGRFANCNCFEIPWGVYFVDINAILNYDIYLQTKNVCNDDGSACTGGENLNKAPVCEAINNNNFIPGADLVSTFSFSCLPTNGLGQTNCDKDVYAGCMTAPCQRTTTPGIVECSCPTFNGPYQVGTALSNPEEECTLGDNLVWSAAYSPSISTIPPTSPCIPDAPGANGCPLYDVCTMTTPPGTDCVAICDAYSCANSDGIEPAFTCDATLCTGECNEQQLIDDACSDLKSCPAAGLAAIAKLESAVGCSCCASQLCGCAPNTETNHAIALLNQRQRNLSITPQCDINGTLCGSEPMTTKEKRGCFEAHKASIKE